MIAANTNSPRISEPAFYAMRSVDRLDTVELRMLIASACGALQNKMGMAHTAKIMGKIASELRAGGDMSLHEVAFAVAQKYFLTVADLTNDDRTPNARRYDTSHPRQEAYWLARQQKKADGSPRHTYPQIGRFFGDRDHTTVIHGVRAHAARLLLESAQ